MLGVEGSGGFVFVLEIDVGVAGVGEGGDAAGEGGEFGGGVAAVLAEAVGGVGLCGVDFGGDEVVGFGYGHGGVMVRKNSADFGGEPGGVAEFEGDGRGVWAGAAESGFGEELGEELGVRGEVWRELEEEEAEAAGFADRG